MISFALLIALVWGIQSLILAGILKKYSSEFVYSMQILFTFFFILFYMFINKDIIISDYNKFTLDDCMTLGLQVFFCSFLANVLYFYLLKYYDAYIITVLVYSAPIFTVLISKYFYAKEIYLYKQIGVIISLIGLVLVSS